MDVWHMRLTDAKGKIPEWVCGEMKDIKYGDYYYLEDDGYKSPLHRAESDAQQITDEDGVVFWGVHGSAMNYM